MTPPPTLTLEGWKSARGVIYRRAAVESAVAVISRTVCFLIYVLCIPLLPLYRDITICMYTPYSFVRAWVRVCVCVCERMREPQLPGRRLH
jgi:hypothetical protein